MLKLAGHARARTTAAHRWRTPIAAACAAALSAAPGLAAEARFGWLGLAPAEAGQRLAQVERAIGGPLEALPGRADKPCQYRTSARRPGVTYVVDNGVLVRVDTRSHGYASVRGARIGDTEASVRKLYGDKLVVTPHRYFERGHMLAVYSPDRRFALVMESNDDGRIITMRGGRVPAVEYLEGCS